MDIIISIALALTLVIAAIHLTQWSKNEQGKLSIHSVHLRGTSVMLIVFTCLTVLLFGMRLMFKPDVSITYNDKSYEVYSNLLAVGTQQIVESKHLLGCEVVLEKNYPLMVIFGAEKKVTKYKVPCDVLTPDMKTDISNVVSYLKEETRTASK